MSTPFVAGGPGTLGAFANGRDNNFNLLRFLAASAVLVSHSFVMATGSTANEPLRQTLDTTLGGIAVDIFFLTSGFLVSGSLARRKDVRSFATARALRIYPALIVAVSLTVLVVGLWFTSLTQANYFSSPQTWLYWVRNSTLITNVVHTLPGAFESNPRRFAVNSSLWTLPYELTMYLILALVWMGASKLRRDPSRLFGRAIVMLAMLSLTLQLLLVGVVSSSAMRLTAMFFVGSAMFVLRDRIPLTKRIFTVLLTTVLVSALNNSLFNHCYPLVLPYLVFYLAYVPGGYLRRFNRIGDYSYGIYIYAWPVQQMTAALVPGVQPLEMFVLSFFATFTLAVASWHLIEKPSLTMKSQARASR